MVPLMEIRKSVKLQVNNAPRCLGEHDLGTTAFDPLVGLVSPTVLITCLRPFSGT
jgi:hypothetical protein